MEYHLASKFNDYTRRVVVVGCGGTGGFAAEGLARLLPPGHELVLIDGDRVEERNLVRQSFYPDELGQFKSQALAERLARKYRRTVAYSVTPVARGWALPRGTALVVGCVDNADARSAIAGAVTHRMWWLDAGNGEAFGQLLVGNATPQYLKGAFDPVMGAVHVLPLPSLVSPELLVAPPASCAGDEQGPTINQLVAALVVETVRLLMEGRLRWWQLYLDLEDMAVRTVAPTPEGVSRVARVPVKRLMQNRKGGGETWTRT